MSHSGLRFGAVAALLLTATPVFGTPDDRWLDTPTGWSYLLGATTSQIDELVASGQRVFNIERLGSNSFDAIGVTNSGAYSIDGMSTVYGLTFGSLRTFLINNNRRIIDLEVYQNGDIENFVAVTVPNTGATTAAPDWGSGGTANDVNDLVANANPPVRLIDLEVYTLNGTKYYAAAYVQNTGAQAHAWWYYIGRTAEQVTELLGQNDARLVDIELDTAPTLFSPATFTVIMIADNPGLDWWYPSLSQSEIGPLLEANGARLTCIERYTDGLGQTRFAVAMVDNNTIETRRIRDAIRTDIPTGRIGFMAKEVGGPVVTSLNANFRFEPSGMIKILHAARAMREVQTTATTLDSPVVLNTVTTPGSSCPSASAITTIPLRTTIQQMMRNGSNEHAEALRQRYGTVGLNNFAASWGLNSTRLNHIVGCVCSQWPNLNTFTASEAVALYEQLANGTIINESNKNELFTMMLNYDLVGSSVLTGIISQEAAGTNLTGPEITAFRAAFDAAWKSGSSNCGFPGDPVRRWRAEGGWASVPFKGSAPLFAPFDREYAVSMFLHESNDAANVTDQIFAYTWETIRLPIREALQSWDAACAPDGILAQPQSDTVDQGDDAQFSVTILTMPGARNYRWQKQINGVWTSLFDGADYSGAGTSVLTVLGVDPSDAGQFRVRITKECGETLSQPATLSVAELCAADFDGNGLLNFFDFSAFLAAYNSQSAGADLAPPTGVWNFFDLNAFIALYNIGCP